MGQLPHLRPIYRKRKGNSTPTGQRGIVEIPKEQILKMLRECGDHDQTQQADHPVKMLGGAGGKLGR
jgi:hypothetical protein